jgi:hypothetical protein
MGRTSVRVIVAPHLDNPVLRIEARSLEPVEAYALCGFDPAKEQGCVFGWAPRDSVLGAPRIRLAEGAPEVCVLDPGRLQSFAVILPGAPHAAGGAGGSIPTE